MSDRGHSDEEGRSSLDDAARRPYRFAGGGAVWIGISDLRGKMLRIEQVLGSRLDPALAERIHELEQQGAVDFLTVPIVDVSRHRFRARTQGGTEVAIALTRDQRLFDGAVLVLKPDHAVVVRVAQERWLRLQPCAIADAIERERRYVTLPRRIAASAILTELPRKMSAAVLVGIDMTAD